MDIKKSGFKRMSMRKALLFSYIFVVLPPFIFYMLMNSNFVNSYKEDLIDSNMQFINEFKLNMEYNIKEIIAMSLTIYTNNDCINILSKPKDRDQIEKVADNKTLNNYLLMLIYKNFISGVYIYTSDGQYYFGNCNTGEFNINETLLSSRWLNSIKPAAGEFAFLGTHQPGQLKGGTPVFSLVRNINDATGKYLGLMLIDIRPDMFASAYQSSDSTSSRKFIVTDTSRSIVYSSENNRIMTLLSDKKYDPVFQNKKGYITYSENGVEYLASYNTSELSKWKVIAITPMESVVEKADSMFSSLLLLAVLSILFAVIFSTLSSSFICRPIKKLKEKMDLVGAGDFEVYCAPMGTQEIFSLTADFNSMIEKIRNLMKNEFQLKLLKKDAEFKALQAQINPHFLYNTLESISALADIEKVPQIGKTCRILSNMFRYSIRTSNDTTLLKYEVQHLQDYISIIRLRFEDQIEFRMNIDDGLSNYAILKLILQPIVENAVNHGFSDLTDKGLITVSAQSQDNIITIKICDNGKGMAGERKAQIMEMINQADSEHIYESHRSGSSSFGLRNIHLRMTSYYGKGFGIASIDSAPGAGTSITVSLPAIKPNGRPYNV